MIVIKIEDVRMDKVVTIAFLTLLLFYLSSATFALARCQPIERDIEIDCKWKGEPVSANLKWTELEEDPATITTNKDAGGTSKSGTTSSQASTAINAQQALMLTGASAGAALAGGGLLVKKKLEGDNSSEQETKQKTSTNTTTSTSSASSTAPKYASDSARSYREGLEPHQDELKSSQGPSAQTQSSTPSQTSTQGQRSNTQNPTKDSGPPTTAKQQYMQKQTSSQSSQQSQPPTQRLEQSDVQTASTLSASAAIMTKELLMQKQMNSLTKESTQASGTQQAAHSPTSTTSQNLGLLASSSSAAQMATAMWPQRQKEFEQLAKQRADLAEKFSVPSYSTGLSLASSFTSATGNAWAKLHDFGSALGNGFAKAGAAIKPYTKYIMPVVVAVVVVASIFLLPPAAPAIAGAGMTGLGISVSQGAGLVGAGILVGGMGLYAAHNTIMTYPQQPNFEVQHTQYIQQPTSEIKDEKGSGTYGEDVAQEQLEQAEIRKDSIIEPHGGSGHQKSEELAEKWLQKEGQMIIKKHGCEKDPSTGENLPARIYGEPDIITKDCLVECEKGTKDEIAHASRQAKQFLRIIDYLKTRGVKKTLVYWFLNPKSNVVEGWQSVINMLEDCGAIMMYGDG